MIRAGYLRSLAKQAKATAADASALLRARGTLAAPVDLPMGIEVLGSESGVYYRPDPDPTVVERRLYLGIAQVLLLETRLRHGDGDVEHLAKALAVA